MCAMDYNDFCAEKQIRDDAPLDFCDWSLNNALLSQKDSQQDSNVWIESVDEISTEAVNELKNEQQRLTDQKIKLDSLNLSHPMALYSAKKIPELQKEVDALSVEIAELDEKLADFSLSSAVFEKLNDERRQKRKRKFWLVEKRIQSILRLPARCADCGAWFDIGHFVNAILNKETQKLLNIKSCQTRLCPACNSRRATKQAFEVLAQVIFMSIYGYADYGRKDRRKIYKFLKGASASFLTLTVENPKIVDVRDCYKKIKKALSILFSDDKTCKESALRNDWIRKNILGALCCLEWFGDKTKDGEAHLHFHILLIHDGELPFSKNEKYVTTIFRRAWAKALGREGEWLAVEWHACRDFYVKNYDQVLEDSVERGLLYPKQKEKFSNVTDPKFRSLFAMVLEVSKYAVTQASLNRMSPENIAELYKQTEYLNQVTKFGVLRGFEFPDGVSTDSMLEMVFNDFYDVSKPDWKNDFITRGRWDVKKYKTFLLSSMGVEIPAPELELPDAPEKLPAEESFDVPLG